MVESPMLTLQTHLFDQLYLNRVKRGPNWGGIGVTPGTLIYYEANRYITGANIPYYGMKPG